jgi:flagellar motility protein MotE (MotC chaperone)
MLRLLPWVFALLLLTFTWRLSDVVGFAQTGHVPDHAGQALAADKEKPDKKADKKSDKSEDKVEPEKTETELPPPDPFAPEYSDEELQVLQSLSKRREQLEQQATDLDNREKFMQAAEKRMTQKLAEMSKMRSEIEVLLGKQQAVEEGRLKQLVSIYETMKPQDAARIFNELDFNVLINIVNRMSSRKSAPIIAQMDAARARELSTYIAKQQALPDK